MAKSWPYVTTHEARCHWSLSRIVNGASAVVCKPDIDTNRICLCIQRGVRGTLIMSGLKRERILQAVETVTSQHKRAEGSFQIALDYDGDNDDTDCREPLAHPHHCAYAPRRLCGGFWHLILFKGRLRQRPRKSARLASARIESAVDRRRRAVSKVPRWRSHEVAKKMPLQTLRVDAR